ncbi:MAG: glutamine-hydrolyzing carbamoyl-phosphate synthase small subunit [Methermicoccaceae archaeon]
MDAVMGLEDGTVVRGSSFGTEGIVCGELVFATQFTGYEEALTDPSYSGQILMFAYPLIGNYGVNPDNFQSEHMQAEATVVREACLTPYHHGASMSISEFLKEQHRIGIQDVDTRSLTIHIRSQGTPRACIIVGSSDGEEAVRLARAHPHISDLNLVEKVSCKAPYVIPPSGEGHEQKIGVLDLGVKQSMLRNLTDRGCEVHVFPSDTSPDVIEDDGVDALLVSNGPGDPKRAKDAISLVNVLAGAIPLYGICFGHQIISLGLGADTYKLKFGHRGANQPVKEMATGKVYITSQNHGFAVSEHSVEDTDLSITYLNLNDLTVEGTTSDYLKIYTVQFHPEACPGPNDTKSFFDRLARGVL